MKIRIVATGAGVVSPMGAGIEAFANALWSGAVGTPESGDFDPSPWLGSKGNRILDRGTRFLCVAARMALTATGLSQEAALEGDAQLGLVCGTMFGGVHSIATFDWTGVTEGPAFVSPMDFPNTVISAPAGQAAIRHKLRGVNSTISAGLASGLYAIQYGAEFLRMGRAKYLMAGGMEELREEASLGFRKLGLRSPTGTARPFGTDRDGTVPGEGAAFWMLETAETALARGLTPEFEVCGFGASHGTAPEDAIGQALEETGIGPYEVGCIIAGASGVWKGDEVEAGALRRVFGDRLAQIPVSAPKACTGEAMGASGAFCAVAAGLALERREAPPTAGFCASEYGLSLSAKPQPFSGEYALVNAFSCDGNNAALVIRRW